MSETAEVPVREVTSAWLARMKMAKPAMRRGHAGRYFAENAAFPMQYSAAKIRANGTIQVLSGDFAEVIGWLIPPCGAVRNITEAREFRAVRVSWGAGEKVVEHPEVSGRAASYHGFRASFSGIRKKKQARGTEEE